jgi:hypothetical protein
MKILDKYIITYSNYLEFNGKVLAYRKKVLFDITDVPTPMWIKYNGGSNGYWINRKWLSESKIKIIIQKTPREIDISNMQWYQQEQLNHVFNLKSNS